MSNIGMIGLLLCIVTHSLMLTGIGGYHSALYRQNKRHEILLLSNHKANEGSHAGPDYIRTKSKFPYGVSKFSAARAEGRFFVDKTVYIRKLEVSGDFLKIWRPRRFGKTLFCDMLASYYDAASSKEQLIADFGDTDIMVKNLTTKEMGKYLVLRLSFSEVSTKADIESSFRKTINTAAEKFSTKYHDAGFLKRPVAIDHDDHLTTLKRLINEVDLSGHQIYLIVDECDAFVNRLLLCIDTNKPDLGLEQYELIVSGKESMLLEWGNIIKEGTVSSIARTFFTGVAPQAFSDGLSSLNMVKDLTFAPKFEGLFGLTADDVSRGLSMVKDLTAEQRAQYLEQMRMQYDGYRFVKKQTVSLFNPQYVLYFLDHLDEYGVPPESLIDGAMSGSTDNVANFLVNNHQASAPYTLRNFVVGYMRPDEMGTFECTVEPAFFSSALFNKAKVSRSLISLAYFHGFLTYKEDEDQRSVLTSPNVIMQTVYVRALFAGLPEQRLAQLEAMILRGKPGMSEFKRIALLGIEEVVKTFGKATGDKLVLSLTKLLGYDEAAKAFGNATGNKFFLSLWKIFGHDDKNLK